MWYFAWILGVTAALGLGCDQRHVVRIPERFRDRPENGHQKAERTALIKKSAQASAASRFARMKGSGWP